MLFISQAPGIKTQSLCQVFTLVVGGIDDRTISIECKYNGVGSFEWEGHGSHVRISRREDISADPKEHADLKRRRLQRWVFQEEEGTLAQVQSEGGHSRNVSGCFKAQTKNMILLCSFYFCAENFYLFFYVKRVIIAH